MLPVRTIHHLSCSGGTLISKCVAVCGDNLFLSEINPVYTQPRLAFAPMDLLSQLHVQYKVLSPKDKEAYFRAQMEILSDISDRHERPICIRDHTHSSFLRRHPAQSSETRDMLDRAGYPSISIATIRHPLDAFVAMLKSNWAAGVDNSLETYCTRVLSFKAYCDAKRIPFWRYETFCLDPTATMKEICAALQLTFNENFLEDFGDIHLTGDSGRSSANISLRERRPVSPELIDAARRSPAFSAVCKAFGYSTDPHAHPLEAAGDIPDRLRESPRSQSGHNRNNAGAGGR